MYENGNAQVSSSEMREFLTSSQLKVKDKKANLAGLQVADLLAYPSMRYILIDNSLMRDDGSDPFGARVREILTAGQSNERALDRLDGMPMKLGASICHEADAEGAVAPALDEERHRDIAHSIARGPDLSLKKEGSGR